MFIDITTDCLKVFIFYYTIKHLKYIGSICLKMCIVLITPNYYIPNGIFE